MTEHRFKLPENSLATKIKLDHVAICHRLAGYDFPWEMNRAYELAILRTFCVPQISQVLQQTGEFVRRPQKRYDDTSLLLGNIMKWGYDSPQGRAAIAIMNRVHRRHDIANEDFLYVLSALIYEPVRWNQRYGWRPFTATEKQALFEFWSVVGQRMGMIAMPQSYDRFEQFNQNYEARHFRYSPTNQVVGDAVITLMQSWLPAIAAPVVPFMVKSLTDDHLRTALGWSRPPLAVRQTVRQILQWSRRAARWLPRRRRASFLVDSPNVTYPDGYDLANLGPETSQPPQTSRCPFLRMQSYFKARA